MAQHRSMEKKRKGLLDHGRIRQLDKLGVTWEPLEQQWEEMFAALVAYRDKYGDCNVPFRWLKNRRLAVMGRGLSGKPEGWKPSGKTASHGLTRSALSGRNWRRRGVEVRGPRRVPEDTRPLPSVPRRTMPAWLVGLGVTRRRRDKQSEERIRRLDELGFVWDWAWEFAMEEVWEEKWESRYAALAEFRRIHGHCRCRRSPRTMSAWEDGSHAMRGHRKRGKLSEERIRRLDELGFVWNGREEPGTRD